MKEIPLTRGKVVTRKPKQDPPTLNILYLMNNKDLTKQMAPESVDIIVTDPPYVKDPVENGLEQWRRAYMALFQMASKVLKPSGFLITYAPQHNLKEIMDILEWGNSSVVISNGAKKLNYYWIIPSLNFSQCTAMDHQRGAICLHKPMLVYQKPPEKKPKKCFADVVRGKRQKAYHAWQQSIHDALGVISRFTEPGDVLYDPFAGTGTNLIAANLLGLKWIGAEIDPKTHTIAVRELQQQPINLVAFGVEVSEQEIPRPQGPTEKEEEQTRQTPIEEANCGGKRPALNRCPDDCPEKTIVPEDHGKEKNYPQGRCHVTSQKLREMQVCPHDPPKSTKKPRTVKS